MPTRSPELGGEGVGLLRSEFLFMERAARRARTSSSRHTRPSRRPSGTDHPLIIRTLDVGGDKPLAYLPIPKEDNPFLGERGIRVGLDRPEILRTQLRAILRASAFGKMYVMFPDDRDACRSCATPRPSSHEEADAPRRRADALRHHGGSARRRP